MKLEFEEQQESKKEEKIVEPKLEFEPTTKEESPNEESHEQEKD